jgi:hypothetical protein
MVEIYFVDATWFRTLGASRSPIYREHPSYHHAKLFIRGEEILAPAARVLELFAFLFGTFAI